MSFQGDITAVLTEHGPMPRHNLLVEVGRGPEAGVRHHFAVGQLGALIGSGTLVERDGCVHLPGPDVPLPDAGTVDPTLAAQAIEFAETMAAHRNALRARGFNNPDIRALLTALVRTQHTPR